MAPHRHGTKVELCFTPTYASWANPIEAHFGPLRTYVIAGSEHSNHTMLTRALHDYLRWRNANARHPDVLAAQRPTAPRSEANDNAAGASPPPDQHDRPCQRSWSRH